MNINLNKLRWFVYTWEEKTWRFIVNNVRELGHDAEPTNVEIPSNSSLGQVFEIPADLMKGMITKKDLQDYGIIVREDGRKVGFPVGPESVRMLLCMSPMQRESVTYRELEEMVNQANYKILGERVLTMAVLKEYYLADPNKMKTFKVYDLVETYKKDSLQISDLKGADKVIYDYVNRRSYDMAIRKRDGKFHLRVLFYPKVHVAKERHYTKVPA